MSINEMEAEERPIEPVIEPPEPLVARRESNDFMAGRTRDFMRRLVLQRAAMFALVVIVLLALTAIVGPLVVPVDPLEQDLVNRLAGSSAEHWLGTDELGRDVLSRLVSAARVSLFSAFLAVGVAAGLGIVPGLVSGYVGGRFDSAIMRATDVAMSFPPLLLAIAVVGILGPGLTNAMAAVGLVFAPRFLRLTRAATLSVREETFVEAARSIGMPHRAILGKHVFPNIVAPLIVQIALAAGFSMLAEASLSFLGLGVQPPDASWGSMLRRASSNFEQAPQLAILPGVAIATAVLTFNVFGDGVRDSIGREERRE